MLGQLPAGGRLPGALQADQHHDRRRLRVHGQFAGRPAEGVDQLLVDDLDDLLGRRQALGQLGPGGLLLDPADEALDDLEVDVGFEEREAYLPGDLVDFLLPQAAAAAHAGEDALEPVGE